MKEFLRTPRFKKTVYILGALIVLSLAFQAGMAVGFHRAEFGHRFDQSYMDAYGRHPEMGKARERDEPFETHGAIGKVLSVSLPTIVVEEKNIEKVVRVSSSTVVRHFRDHIDITTIKPNDFIVVIGEPNNNSEVVAKFIRMLPPPPDVTGTNNTATSSATSSAIK